VASDGTVLDPTGIAVSTAVDDQYYPSVASNGTDYFVAWKDDRNFEDIYGARVRASDGLLLDGPPGTGGIAVSTAAKSQYYPSVASNGADYFVAWTDYRSGADWDIYGTRVAPDGTVLDPAGIAVSTAANSQIWPSAASNGTDYFVAWHDRRSGTNYDIYGARVRASDGYLHDGPPDTGGIAVSTAAGIQWYPSVASNGTDYFVAWHDKRSGADYDIYGARVASSDGTVLDVAGLLIQQSSYDDSFPAVAYSACGKYLVAYSRFYDDPSFHSQRVMARTIQGSAQESPYVTLDVNFDPLPTLTELCGDGDGVVEPGEEWQVTVQLYNQCVTANNVMADLEVNAGSVVAATTCNNPGIYGSIPPGGTAQFTYSFVVDAGAVCVNDIMFDITNIVSAEGAYLDEIAVFNVQVGTSDPGPTEVRGQATDPLTAQNGTAFSDFAPAFTIPGAAKSATLSYTHSYTPPSVLETSTQFTDPITANNNTVQSVLIPSFTLSAPAISATLSYTLTGTSDLVNCVRVELIDPLSKATILKDYGAADANPYTTEVLAAYDAGGPGTYTISLTELAGCSPKPKDAVISSAQMDVTGFGNEDEVTSVRIELVDPFLTATILKDYGASDASPYDVTGLYTGAGTYRIQVSENAGGTATVTAGTLSVTAPDVTECDLSACACPCAADIMPDAPLICEGESVTLDANPSGGVPPYTFLWSTGATSRTITVSPAVTTTYDVTVTDDASSTRTRRVERRRTRTCGARGRRRRRFA
jgi:hypothetical protein